MKNTEGDDHCVGELLDEHLASARAGNARDRDAFLAAHPEVAPRLKAALGALDFIERAAAPLAHHGAPDEPATGTLGDYRLVREVGRGGMGVVYEAQQISLGRRVALKVLPFAAVLDERQLQRFRHEAQAAALLHHTNIVPIYGVGNERGVHYYAMQFVDGRTLAEVIAELRASARGPDGAGDASSSAEAQALTPQGTNESPEYCRSVARLGVQAADALEHAHEHGVVHRDVKPANLMLDAKGHLFITDFGLARSRSNSNLTVTGSIVGTLSYMSPEQALGKGAQLDHRTDVWSLGVTLYEALTLQPAFAGEEPAAVIRDIAERDPARPRRLNAAVPQALETILLKAVAKDPEARYASARALAEDLRRYLDDQPVVARRPPLADRVALWARRHRAAVFVAAAALLVTTTVLAVSTWRIAREERLTRNALDESKANAKRLLDEQRRTSSALAESRRQAERAEANYGTALAAVDRMLTRVGDERLAGVPGLEHVRRGLLADAVQFYAGFLEEEGASSEVRLEAARARQRLGDLHLQLGDNARAAEELRQARSILAETAPTDGSFHPDWAAIVEVDIVRANVLSAQLRREDAIAVLDAAVTLAERCAAERPDEVRFVALVAKASRALGELCREAGQWERSETAFRKAVGALEPLVAAGHSDENLRVELSEVCGGLGYLALFSGRGDAEGSFRRAVQLAERGASSAADSHAFDRWTASLHALGQLVQWRDPEDAERILRTALDADRRRTEEYPHHPRFALRAVGDAGYLEAVLWRLGRTEQAAAVQAECLARARGVAARFPDAPDTIGRVATGLDRFGNMASENDRHYAAEAYYQLAEQILESQSRAFPADGALLGRLAEVLRDYSEGLLGSPGREGDAVTKLRRAADIGERLAPEPGAPPGLRRELGRSFDLLARALQQAGDAQGADAAWRRSDAVWRDLVTSLGEPMDMFDLALALRNRSAAARGRADFDTERTLLRESADLQLQVHRSLPADGWRNLHLVRTLASLARSEIARRRRTEAERVWREASRIVSALWWGDASDPVRRDMEVVVSGGLGGLLLDGGDIAEAETLLRRAVDLGTASCREAERAEDTRTFRERRDEVRASVIESCMEMARLLASSSRSAEAATFDECAARMRAESAGAPPGGQASGR